MWLAKKTGRARRPVESLRKLERSVARAGAGCVLRIFGGVLGGILLVAGRFLRVLRSLLHVVHRAGGTGRRARATRRSRIGSLLGLLGGRAGRGCRSAGLFGALLGFGVGIRLGGGGGGGSSGRGFSRVLLCLISSILRLLRRVAAGTQGKCHRAGECSRENGTSELHWISPGLGRGKPREWPRY